MSAIRIRPPSCCNVKAFPKCLLAAVGEHDMHDVHTLFKLSSRLSLAAHLWCTHVHEAAMFGHRTSDFTSVSLNNFHASETVCKTFGAANVLIFMGKHVMLTLFQTGFVKRSSVIFARQSNAFFNSGIALSHRLKSVFCSAKNALLWLFIRPHLWHCKKEAVQNRTDVLGCYCCYFCY